jgi:uncharacterized Zn-binding protein involved in type VI secretion
MAMAARIGETTNHPGTVAGPGVESVLIAGRPAAVAGDTHICALPPQAGPHPPNPLVGGSSSVLIGGRPAMRVGDSAACGATILTGTARVLIGG